MKNVYLVCNSHLDPVWQWNWDEGMAAAHALFYSAANLCDEYDYIFNHNEAYLYENIERLDPVLFSRIQDLVKKGKWKIMGGWYVQPDCMVPSGETFIRQIALGREYFLDKFGVVVTAALNFDSFAHTRGLATILNKCRYASYTICRPMPYHDLYAKEILPNEPFIWKGYDGSKIKVLRTDTLYLTTLGNASSHIRKQIDKFPNLENLCVLWGVGNHGGGPSRLDLERIKELQEEKKNEINIKHSTLEEYFSVIHPDKVVSRQLLTFFKSYSSCSNIKQIHDELENALYLTEKICTIADLEGVYHYDKEVLKNAEKVLCQIGFHDVLSGTAIKTGTDASIDMAKGAISNLKSEFYKAFTYLANKLPSAKPDDDNFVLFNPFPYEFNDFVTAEFSAKVPVQELDKQYKLTLYDKDNNIIPHQIIKEESELNYDRRMKMIFNIKIPACSLISIGIHKDVIDRIPRFKDDDKDIVIEDNIKSIRISRSTGLLESFKLNGKEFLAGPSVVPTIFNDDEDPWGWFLTRFDEKHNLYNVPYDYSNAFKSIKLDTAHKGIYHNLKSVTKIEEGEFLTEVQSTFKHNDSHIIIKYKIYKNKPYIDVDIHSIWLEEMKGLKIKFNLAGSSNYFAQAAFGIENYKANKLEVPMNRYVGVLNNDEAFVIYNKSGIHSCSKTGRNLYLTLFNGSVYCAHPIDSAENTFDTNRDIIKDRSRYLEYIETGIHDHHLRLGVNKIDECEKNQKEFNEPVYSLYFFPHGNNSVTKNTILLSNSNIVISALKRRNDGTYMIRLYNGSEQNSSTSLNIKGSKIEIQFKKFEFKTFIYNCDKISEAKDAAIF